MLLLGTGDGVYRRRSSEPDTHARRVLNCGRVTELESTEDCAYAATLRGLYRTTDGGDSWTDLDVPEPDVWAVHAADDRLYAGCYPASLFASTDGERWEQIDSVQSAPGHERWYCPGDEDRGRVRTVRTVPGQPNRLLVGVEVGGLYVSDDGGETWTARREPVVDDVHHVTVRGPDEYLVCCGELDLNREYGPAGLFRTTDGGETWTRLDLGDHAYVRETLVHDRVLYVSGAQVTPGDWVDHDGAQAALFESRDDGATFEAVSYPGEPQEIVLSWAVDGGEVYGGTGTRTYDEGRLIRRTEDEWVDAGRLPTNVYSLCAV